MITVDPLLTCGEMLARANTENHELKSQLAELREQLKDYEAALEFYGDRDNFVEADETVAREALKKYGDKK